MEVSLYMHMIIDEFGFELTKILYTYQFDLNIQLQISDSKLISIANMCALEPGLVGSRDGALS
jgi:hypothetical protein